MTTLDTGDKNFAQIINEIKTGQIKILQFQGVAVQGYKKKEWGKMIPFIMDIDTKRQLADLRKVVEYKRRCK